MKIKELRERTKTNPNELAKLLGISIQSYYRYETGQNEPNIKRLMQIANYYGVSIDYLCENETNKNLKSIPTNQTIQKVIELIQQLNENNINKVIGYINALLENQKKL